MRTRPCDAACARGNRARSIRHDEGAERTPRSVILRWPSAASPSRDDRPRSGPSPPAFAGAPFEARRLQRWLRQHPLDESGEPCYLTLGRTKVLDDEQINRVRHAIEAEAARRIGTNNEAKSDQGYVYFIDGGECIKIGYSRSLEHRFRKMLTDAPVRLELLHIEEGTIRQEKLFHQHFAAIRVRGEWFQKTSELLEFIEQRKRIKAGNA